MTKTIRLGVNRGNPRLWLEGGILSGHGFSRGVAYTVALTDTAIVFTVDVDGKRHVSGKTKAGGDWPIIDMNGANLAPFAGQDLTLTADFGRIVIAKAE